MLRSVWNMDAVCGAIVVQTPSVEHMIPWPLYSDVKGTELPISKYSVCFCLHSCMICLTTEERGKSLIIKTSCLGHTKHLCPRVYNLMIGACVKCKTLTRLKFCGSHVHVQCLLHLWTIFNTVTIFNSLSEVPLPWTFTSALDTIQYVRKAFLQHFNLQEV